MPKQLCNPEFRFYLIKQNEKIPIERHYTTINCYPFFHTKVIEHLKANGNIGILTGFDNLIVIDFDDRGYYRKTNPRKNLPLTFCVKTANKKMYHLYYYLKGEIFQTIGVDVDKKRMVDIMGAKGKVVCPPSSIDRKYYTVVSDLPIAHITLNEIMAIFKVKPKRSVEYTGKQGKCDNEAVMKAIEVLKHNNIIQNGERHFKCPHHPSIGGKCLYIGDDGHLFCFHCKVWYQDVHKFVDDLNGLHNRTI